MRSFENYEENFGELKQGKGLIMCLASKDKYSLDSPNSANFEIWDTFI